jgi:glucokinase-like ROK family protein
MKKQKVLLVQPDLQTNANKIKVLHLIWSRKEIKRAEILKLTGLSAPTLTRIIENLVRLKLIQTDGLGSSIGGRPPQIINFNSQDNYIIGIDIGGTFIRAVLSNLAGDFIFEIHIPTNLKDQFIEVMQQVGKVITRLTERAHEKNLRLWGIGIAVSGMVNKSSGIVEYSPIFNWKNANIREALSKYTSLPVALENVVNLIALGELLYGVGGNYKNFVCLNVGYGIGAGIIIDGKLFSGAQGLAGEIGHIVVDRISSRRGMEGVTGTLEALASGYGIAAVAQEHSRLYVKSSLYGLDTDKIDAKSVFDAAKKGDQLASEIVNRAAGYISIGIDTIIKLLNTECIVLSGGLTKTEGMLQSKVQQNIKNYTMNTLSHSVPIVKSSFGENGALMGCFSLILQKILHLEIQHAEVVR